MTVDVAIKHLSEVLHPIKVVVWGELAMADLGVPTAVYNYMLVPSNEEFPEAADRLRDAGFRHTPWSFGSIDPDRIASLNNPISKRAQEIASKGFQMLDSHSVRYEFPLTSQTSGKVVLLQSQYVHLAPPTTDPIDSALFRVDRNLYWPSEIVLLESFIRTLLQDSDSLWQLTLTVWALTYTYGMLGLKASALDRCSHQPVIAWFNETIKQFQDGLDMRSMKRIGKRSSSRLNDVSVR